MSSLWPFAFHCRLDKDEWMHRVLALGWLIDSIYSSWIGILGVRCDARGQVTWADELRVVDQKRFLQSSMRSRECQKRGQHPVCMIRFAHFFTIGIWKGISFSGVLLRNWRHCPMTGGSKPASYVQCIFFFFSWLWHHCAQQHRNRDTYTCLFFYLVACKVVYLKTQRLPNRPHIVSFFPMHPAVVSTQVCLFSWRCDAASQISHEIQKSIPRWLSVTFWADS